MSGWNQEQEYQAGIRAERERIIKLLEENIGHGDPEGDCYFTDAIALIKGENK